MLRRWVSLPLVVNRMWREVRESIVRIVFTIEQETRTTSVYRWILISISLAERTVGNARVGIRILRSRNDIRSCRSILVVHDA